MQRNSKVGPLALPPVGSADEYEAAFWQHWRTQLRLVVQKPWLAAPWLKQSHMLLARFNRTYDHLRQQPRHVRRRVQRQWGASLAGAALALALLNAPVYAANITVDGATCALVDAITAANTDAAVGGCAAGSGADTITLQGDVTLTAVNGNAYDSDTGLPVITSEIVINGGHTISRDAGAPAFRLLAVSASGNLTLNNTTLTGGYNADQYTSKGGAIYNAGTLTVNGSTFSGNSAANRGGGIANANNGTVAVSNSTFSGNTASNAGGTIYNAGTVAVSNSTFSSNSATNTGGAIANYGTVTVSNSTFSGNTAHNIGGAIVNSGGTVTVSDSTLSGNSASNGGGIINIGGTVTVSDSTLSGNSADFGGGGIYNGGGTVTVSNTTLSGNSASQAGGGIANYGTVTVSNSTLSGNSADFGGGGIANRGGTATVSNSTLSGNSASTGGGIYHQYGSLTLAYSLISGNTATSGQEVFNYLGGCLSAAGMNAIDCAASVSAINTTSPNLFGHSGLTNAQAFHNFTPGVNDITATSDGTNPTALAAILNPLTNNGGGTLTHALVTGSPAIDAGGDSGLDTDQRSVTRPQGAADDIGAVEALPINVALNGDNCNLSDAIMAANQDRSYGTCNAGVAGADTITLLGDISLLTANDDTSNYLSLPPITSTITIEGAGFTLERDAAATDPFGLLVVQETGDLTLNDITLTGAYSKYGALASIGQLTLNNSTITGNTGAVLGGGLFNVGTATLNNSSVTNNNVIIPAPVPIYGGGGISNWVGSLTLNNSVVSGNNSAAFAGGINNVKYGTVTLNASTLSNNTAAYAGGAIFSYGDTSVSATNSTISNNQAAGGGGFYLANDSLLTLANSTVTGNTGTGRGGGIVTDQAMQLTGNLIAGNISPDIAEIVGGPTPVLARRTLQQSSNTLTQKLRAQVAKNPFLQRVQALVEARKAAQSQAQTVQSASPNPVSSNANLFGHSGLTTAEAFDGFVPAGSDLVATSDGALATPLTAILNTTLADNGGPKAGVADEPILTHALVPGSPAIDAAGNTGLDTDQRNILRPQGTADDIGALESNDWVNVNSHLTLQGTLATSYSANPDSTYGAESPAGVFTINATFRNTASPAVGLRNVYFKVTSLISINDINNYLLNADGAPGQVGSTVSVANSAFGDDSLWTQNEDLPMSFQIGLMERRRFAFFVDVYGIIDVNAAGAGAVQHLGSFQFTLDPTENIVRTIFLPVVVKE